MKDKSQPLALINGRLFDGRNNPETSPATVLVEGAVLTAVGPTADVSLPEACRVIDLEGRTLLPGLMDGHMHVTGMPGLMDETANLEAQLRASEILRECLRWGTTTVGHAGGCQENLVLRDMIDKGTLKGRARLLVSGVVTATGGHVKGAGADGPWEIRKMVRQMAVAGMDFFKTCATGGFQWAHEGLGTPDYSLEELQALVEEAHMRGRRVHVHAHAQPGIQNAIEAGCDVILHGANIDSAALRGIASRGLIYMPTLYITSEHIWGSGNRPEHMTSRMKAAYKPHREGVVQARELGIPIATGTDGEPRPGALVHELCELVGCGFTPQEAIVAATRNTAEALGVGNRLGALEPGKLADCIVIEGDPLADISVLTSQESIVMVIKEGRVEVDRLTAEAARTE
jgi:imidazolonepropionase-like amidohydrolase